MGRPNKLPEELKDKPVKLRMVRLRWVDGDYDEFGAYFGCDRNEFGIPKNYIYCAWRDDGQCGYPGGICVFVRAFSREGAKIAVRDLLPYATFHN